VILPTAAGYHSVVCLSVCIYGCMCVIVSFMHPTKAAGQNEMPFGSETCMVPNNVVFVLDRGPGAPMGSRDLEIGPPSLQ